MCRPSGIYRDTVLIAFVVHEEGISYQHKISLRCDVQRERCMSQLFVVFVRGQHTIYAAVIF
jgi:hypothetical protein